ncbi:MAG: hypothetical protein KKE62_19555 [Proteobacteria bacterium]|nr:hypothetical protein [Pseudomonadota bacterium]MBU1390012.1 hypothetical protein [Pseudomonadota bacterium]MBU1545037.1 hypothetical protein [Pseudomonadota bacterium]MBU2431215.1 hypothetical protein [Pseudomonadota bacterium]MBU2480359.1 hypothetical protein [Pseudomonadota bacterium]
MNKAENKGVYTCNEYREEMILLSLQKKLSSGGLTPEEKKALLREITEVEKQMGID